MSMSKYFSHSKNITQQCYPAPKSFYEAGYRVFEDMSDETLLSKNRLSQLLSKKAKAECYKNLDFFSNPIGIIFLEKTSFIAQYIQTITIIHSSIHKQ